MKSIELLRNAVKEIDSLRRRNELLAAKVEVMDSFMQVLHTRPAEHVQTMAVDVAWELRKEISTLESEQAGSVQ